MLTIIKYNIICIVLLSYIIAMYSNVNAKPVDVYDDWMGNDDKLFVQMLELIDSISSDDSDDGSRFQSDETRSGDKSVTTPSEKCMLPMRKGVCRALIPRWSYDPTTKECREFKFGGCDGNGNNFSTKKSCMDTCRGM